jgi:putative DNA primase/helicase
MDYKGDLINFLQTAAGWSISGDISEQSMFILYGTGANGKSTFLNVIMNILGD